MYGREQVNTVIYEYSLSSWHDVDDSRIKLSYLPKIPFELLRIRYYYKDNKSNLCFKYSLHFKILISFFTHKILTN